MRTAMLGIACLALVSLGCGPKRMPPMPTTNEGRACVRDCSLIAATCNNGCGFWLLVAWPVIFFCSGDCAKERVRCEATCPDMRVPAVAPDYQTSLLRR